MSSSAAPAQPSADLSEDNLRRGLTAALAVPARTPDVLLPMLHAVQDTLGWIPPAAIAPIAAALNLSRAEVHGVVSFYAHFRTHPPGRCVVQVCRAESCQALGGRDLERHVRQRLGIDFDQTSADGAFSLEAVYCLGHCAVSPALTIDGVAHGRMEVARFDALLATRAGVP